MKRKKGSEGCDNITRLSETRTNLTVIIAADGIEHATSLEERRRYTLRHACHSDAALRLLEVLGKAPQNGEMFGNWNFEENEGLRRKYYVDRSKIES